MDAAMYSQQRRTLWWGRAALFVAALALLATCMAHAVPRSTAAKAAFKRASPCPATGQTRGPCPGYIVDHVHPLCAGGADAPSNMQWQTAGDAKRKDRDEKKLCRAR